MNYCEGCAKEVRAKDTELAAMREALLCAKQFIQNGVEYGYILMPEMEQDSAHQTLPKILAALQSDAGSKLLERHREEVAHIQGGLECALEAARRRGAERDVAIALARTLRGQPRR